MTQTVPPSSIEKSTPAPTLPTVVMYCPDATGGMAQYTWELLSALAREHAERLHVELVADANLDALFRSADYSIHAVLPQALPREQYANPFAWIAGRLKYYFGREQAFVAWLKTRPDVAAVHFQAYQDVVTLWNMKQYRAMGKALFFTVHNIRPHAYRRFVPRSLVDLQARKVWRACDGLFVHTVKLQEELAAFLGPGHPPIFVSPHGTWTVREALDPPDLAERLAQKRILFFGTLRPNKGLHLLLQAMPFLHDFRLTIAGQKNDSVYWEETIVPLLRACQEQGVCVEVQEGFLPEAALPALFRAHSIVALPYTDFAAQSGVLYMAVAHQLPVVATGSGGMAETIRAFGLGEVVDSTDPEAFAVGVRRLFASSEVASLQERLASAKARLSWAESARATAAAYQEILARTRALATMDKEL